MWLEVTKWAELIITYIIAWGGITPRNPLPKESLDLEYDYVIVGAGSAGAILAARLSEDPDVTVALLEAGQDNDHYPRAATPLSYPTLQRSDMDWNYLTVPQQHACISLLDRRVAYARGKALGGTSSINAMMAIRCSRHDYDRWAAMGNEGWSYEDVLPYFKKIETVTDKKFKESAIRGENGPVQVSEIQAFQDATTAFIEAAESQGFKVGDVNAEEMTDKVMVNQANIGTDGRRQSTAVTYLKPAMSRNNLHVLTNAHVTKVLFAGKRAVGVQYMHGGKSNTVNAHKEVILSAGAIGSPQILLLSGVGPMAHLQDLQIPVVADLPVGENLVDHVNAHSGIVTLEEPAALIAERLSIDDRIQHLLYGTGPFSTTTILATAFSRSKHQPDSHRNPYLQYLIMASAFNDERTQKNLNMKPEIHEAIYGGLDGKDGMLILAALQQPKSVGYVRLNSTDPFDPPLINPNYLAEEIDVDHLLEGLRMARRIVNSEPLTKKLKATLLDRIHPNCTTETYDSDEYWKCYIRHNTLPFYHPTSSCRMGPDEDSNSVVDPKLRVHGLEGLRVVDASIMPYITTGNTNFPTMMIAERAADIIKGRI